MWQCWTYVTTMNWFQYWPVLEPPAHIELRDKILYPKSGAASSVNCQFYLFFTRIVREHLHWIKPQGSSESWLIDFLWKIGRKTIGLGNLEICFMETLTRATLCWKWDILAKCIKSSTGAIFAPKISTEIVKFYNTDAFCISWDETGIVIQIITPQMKELSSG